MKQLNSRMTWHMKRTCQWLIDAVCIASIFFFSVTYFLTPETVEMTKHPRWGDASAHQIYWCTVVSAVIARFFNRYVKWNWCYGLLDEVWIDEVNQTLSLREGNKCETIPIEDVFDIMVDDEQDSVIHIDLKKGAGFGERVSFLFHTSIRFDENGSPNAEYVELCEILGMACPPFAELPEKSYYNS